MKLYSYVVDHDHGFSPNPYHGVCTLAHCKFRRSKHGKPNIVELAEKGDWVVGTGGANLKKSAGHGKLIYAMRITKKLKLRQYYRDYRYIRKRRKINGSYIDRMGDIFPPKAGGDISDRYVLISRHFYYFGTDAITIPKRFRDHPRHPFEKKGPGFRLKYDGKFVDNIVNWLESKYQIGRSGDPCTYTDQPVKSCRRC